LKRGQLTRDELVTEAIHMVDTEGLERLTMRRLAQRLGCGTMTLYGHVARREDLIDAIIERLLAEIDFHTDPGDTWADVLRRSAGTYSAMVLRHPVAFRLVALVPIDRPPVSRHLAAAVDALQRTGLDREHALTLMAIADAFATGFFLAQSEAESGEVDAGRHKYDLSEADKVAMRLSDMLANGLWELGTEVIIAGIRQKLAEDLPVDC
jgi:AcrR family transcriptional regulator